MKIEINLTQKKIKVLKKLFGKDEFKTILEQHIEDWLVHLVNTKYGKNKTIEDKLTDLTK